MLASDAPAPRYPLVWFDFDGTLVDSFGWFAHELQGAARRHGFRQVQPHELETLRRMNPRELLASLQIPWWKVPAIARDLRRRKASAAPSPRFAGVDALLDALRARGVRLGVVSSDSAANVRRALGASRCAEFACVRGGVSLFGKARALRQVLARLGEPPWRAVYVGDELRDVDAAREVGLAQIAVGWGYAHPERLAQARPSHAVASVAELHQLLLPPRSA